jgi:hypothetical protein
MDEERGKGLLKKVLEFLKIESQKILRREQR